LTQHTLTHCNTEPTGTQTLDTKQLTTTSRFVIFLLSGIASLTVIVTGYIYYAEGLSNNILINSNNI